MRVEICVSSNSARRWQWRLRDCLLQRQPDLQVSLRSVQCNRTNPTSVELLLSLERLLLRRSLPTLSDPVKLKGPLGEQAEQGDEPDVLIDLTGADAIAQKPNGPLILRPLYDGSPNELTAVAALLSGAQPSIALEERSSGDIVAHGLPSLEGMDGLIGGLEALFSRLTTLIVHALLSPRRVYDDPPSSLPARSPAAAEFFLRNMARHCALRIYNMCCHSPHWRIGWRYTDGPGVLETGGLAGRRWNVLPDLGDSFAADPFPILWRGQYYIFFERFDYRANKGIIYAQRLDAHGPVGAPVLVLEEPWHLSYPFLIAQGDELYMLPEASMSGALTLYRCTEFPGKWEPVNQFLSGIEAADATLFHHEGRFWMMSVIRDGYGGFSDTLALHHSPSLFGDWEEHARHPLLIDASQARPAGRVVHFDGALWRPVQDCSTGYGKKLALMRIDQLDPENFSQTRVKLISPGADWPGTHLHTLNRWGRLECIDGAASAPKNKQLRRFVQDFEVGREKSTRFRRYRRAVKMQNG